MTRVAGSRMARGLGRAVLGSVLFVGGLTIMTTAQVVTSQPAAASATPQSIDLSAGTSFVCAVTLTATVDCWGTGRYGQLGDGTDTSSAVPVAVAGVHGIGSLSGVTSVASGGRQACAVTLTATVDCWGTGRDGQLGDGSYASSTVPVTVESVGRTGPLSTVAAITAGYAHTCELTTSGSVDCWGTGRDGQLGDGSYAPSTVPVTVESVGRTGPLSTVTAITAGGYETCALTSAGGADCWGTNATGQLGDGSLTSSSSPEVVKPVTGTGALSTVSSIAAGGYHVCAVTTRGAAECWGDGTDGQLGDGRYLDSDLPIAVKGVDGTGTLSTVAEIRGGFYYTCAVRSSGNVDCWGTNTTGELGDNSYTATDVPVEVRTGSGVLSGAVTLAAGGEDACVIQTTGHVDCWGSNDAGQLGDGSFGRSNIPVAVEGVRGTGALSTVTAVSAGEVQACALVTDHVDCWGDGAQGELGDGSTTSSTLPVPVKAVSGTGTLSTVTAVSAGGGYGGTGEVGYTCALLSTGHVDCWGTNATGQLGDGSTTSRTLPVPVKAVSGTGTLSAVTAIVAGYDQTCAVITGGRVDCWGTNATGQLGDGSTTSSTLPVPVKSVSGTGTLSNVTEISAGAYHTCALTSAGDVDCWGAGPLLGDGSTTSSTHPVPVKAVGGTGTLSGVAGISAEGYFTCAVTSAGHVDCWGYGDTGDLGDGSTTSSTLPVPVKAVGGTGTLSNVTEISAGHEQACALTTAGTVDCWGSNYDGQLGSGSFVETSDVPVAVIGAGGTGLLSTVSKLSAGGTFVCVVMTSAADCWGTDYYGQLGDGVEARSSLPVQVPGLVLGTGSAPPPSTTTSPTSPTCPVGTAGCSSKTAVGARGVSVSSKGANVTGSGGHGTLAVGGYAHDPVGAVPAGAGTVYGLAVSTGATIKTVTFDDCSMGAGTSLVWWDGGAWVPLVGESTSHVTIGGATCLSVTLGSTSKPSVASVERLTRSSRLGAALITSAR